LNVAETAKLQTNTSLTASTTTTNDKSAVAPADLDAVREFKVLTGTYSANTAAGRCQVIVTTQAGTNAFHGSLWEFHRIRRWMPATFRNAKASFRRNQFGGVLGGPIKKDRTFFFAGYEGNAADSRKRAWRPFLGLSSEMAISAPFNAGPHPLMEIVRFQENGFSINVEQTGRWILALYPLPNRSGSPNFDSAAAGHFNIDQWSARVDHRFGINDNVYGAYEFADSSEVLCSVQSALLSARCAWMGLRRVATNATCCRRVDAHFFSAPYQRSAHRLHTIRFYRLNRTATSTSFSRSESAA